MAAHVGMILIVDGKSNKGRSRIGSHGNAWEITKLSRTVGFDVRSGEWVLLRSQLTQYERWMLLNQDADFVIVGVK